jgi:hypothetical protein
MEKRYQVFVSSTYEDLGQHRRTVIEQLMNFDAFPIGMELFPASDNDAWTFIKRAISESDYYFVIIGGKYGSVDADGISYTEKEYDYAAEIGKPIAAFLHASPGDIASKDCENDPEKLKRLDAFRDKAKKKLCKFWSAPEELTLGVLQSFHHMVKTFPSGGWTRAENVKTGADAEVLSSLERRVMELERENGNLQQQLTVQSANKTTEKKPRIVLEYPQFLRRVQIEWEVEEKASPKRDYNLKGVRKMFGEMMDQLLGFLLEVDQSRHPLVSMIGREAMTKINDVRHGYPQTAEDPIFWQSAKLIIQQLNHLGSIIEKEKWESE